MVNIVSRSWTRISEIGVPRGFVIAVATALVVWLLVIAAGPLAIVLAAPSMLVFLVFFGSLFVVAIRRSRFLPRADVVQFFAPVALALALSIASGWIGIRAAHFVNDHVFRMPDTYVR